MHIKGTGRIVACAGKLIVEKNPRKSIEELRKPHVQSEPCAYGSSGHPHR
jgi:hypothetical protein